MQEVLKSLKSNIEYLEKVAPKLKPEQKENILVELKATDETLKRMVLLCMVLSK